MLRRRKPNIDSRIERQICTGLIVSEQFIREIKPILKPYSFQIPFTRTIADWCLEFFAKYGKPAGRNIQDIFIEHRKSGLDPNTAELIEDFLTGISDEYENSAGFNAGFTLDKAQAHFKLTALENHRHELNRCISAGQIEEAERIISDFRPVDAELKKPGIEKAIFKTSDFMNLKLPLKRTLLNPWLTEASITLLTGWRGHWQDVASLVYTRFGQQRRGFWPLGGKNGRRAVPFSRRRNASARHCRTHKGFSRSG